MPALERWAHYVDGMLESQLAEIPEMCRIFWLGLALGSLHGGWRLTALAVYEKELVPKVIAALGDAPCAVLGPRGFTIFTRADLEQPGRRFRRRGLKGRRTGATLIEFQARGSFAVIPPTPYARQGSYDWVGRPLLEVGVDALPQVTTCTLDEMEGIIDGPGEPFRTLNKLSAHGAEEARRAAVESLVGRGWPDEAVVARVGRALQEAQVRAGEPGEASRLIELIPTWVQEARRKTMPPPSARKVTERWLEARPELPRTPEQRKHWWTRSSDAYADCRAWAEAEGYPVPHEVAWGTTLTRLGIKSAVKKIEGRSTRMRNLSLKPADRWRRSGVSS